jgi:hypothetical protein
MGLFHDLVWPGEREIWPFAHFFTTLTLAAYMPSSYNGFAVFASLVVGWELLEKTLSRFNVNLSEKFWADSVLSDGSMAATGWILSRYCLRINGKANWYSSSAMAHVATTAIAAWIAEWLLRRLKRAKRIRQPSNDPLWTLLFTTTQLILINLIFECSCSPSLQTIAAAAAAAVFFCDLVFAVGPFAPLLIFSAVIVFFNEI